MQTTLRDVSVLTVSERARRAARAWIAARQAWEDRLDELEHGTRRHGGAAA